MKKIMLGSTVLILLTGNILISAPKNVKKTESQKMADEINRIEKRVQEIQKDIETYTTNEEKLDELEKKFEETKADLNY